MGKISYTNARTQRWELRNRIISTIIANMKGEQKYEPKCSIVEYEVNEGTYEWMLEYFNFNGIRFIDRENDKVRFQMWDDVSDWILFLILEDVENNGLIEFDTHPEFFGTGEVD